MNAVNLIPSDRRRPGRSLPTGLPFLGLVVGLVVVLAATVMFVRAHDRVESKQSQLASVQATAARWTAAAATYARDVTLAKQRERKIGSVEELAGQRTDWSHLLGQLAAVMPARSQLSSMTASAAGTPAATSSTSAPGSAATSSAPSSGSQIQLSACAASQSVVAQTMVDLRRITGVSSVSLSSSTSSGSSGTSGSETSATSGGCAYPVSFAVTLAFDPPTSATSSGAATSSSSPTASQPTSDTSSTNKVSGVSQ